MANRPDVLFVSHDASRSGAPIVMLHFLRWLKANSDLQFRIVLCAGGDLEPEFGALGPVCVLEPWRAGLRHLAARARRRWLLRELRGLQPRLIYANTIANGRIVEALADGRRPVLSHVHELENTIRDLGAANFSAVKRSTSRYIACAHAVKSNLVDNHGVSASDIDVVHGFIPMRAAQTDLSTRDRARAEIGIPPTALVVGGSGYASWRKGTDIFVQLAQRIAVRRPDLEVHFLWVGETKTDRFRELAHDIRATGLEDRIHFTGARGDPLTLFHAFDVFAMVSREDPFPLVCLEAASIEKPIVCFDGAGAVKDFVEQDSGFVVPYLDIETLAARTIDLLDSAALRQSFGARGAEKVRLRHDVTVGAPRVLKIIEACLGHRTAR